MRGETVVRITRVSRGVGDPRACASFLSWLLGLATEERPDGIRVIFSNGDLVFREVASKPVAIGLQADRHISETEDPDGVPVSIGTEFPVSAVGAKIDHVRLNCANLAETVAFYRGLGFHLTWAGYGEETLFNGYHKELINQADWVHLSSQDGYLSISQADWRPYGVGLSASGPPRFLHVGLAVHDLAVVENRLKAAGIPYLHPEGGPLGHQVYVNDPSGDPAVGNNLEIYCYQAGVQRSGS